MRAQNISRTFWLIAIGALSLFTAMQTAAAQSKKRGPQKPAQMKKVAPAGTKTDCGGDVELRLSGASSAQGALLQAELRSPIPLTDIAGTWDQKPVPFWPDSRAATTPGKSPNAYRALLGVDLEKPAGTYEFSTSAKAAGGAAVICQAQILVKAGKFATEHLKVAPNFVEPNPEQLAKAQEDSKQLRELYATITPEKLWQGKFRIPLDGVSTGANFGKRRVLNGKPSSPHSGVDMPAPTGTPVHAAQRGRVVLAQELYFSGNTVLIDHGFGIYTLYGHFSETDAKPGDMVEAGAVIGKVGATGRVTGPHLHWGLTINRSRVNALSLVTVKD